jgi:hypothetical protein
MNISRCWKLLKKIESHNATSLFSLTPENKKPTNDVTLKEGLPQLFIVWLFVYLAVRLIG